MGGLGGLRTPSVRIRKAGVPEWIEEVPHGARLNVFNALTETVSRVLTDNRHYQLVELR
jgi:hypothetical protein